MPYDWDPAKAVSDLTIHEVAFETMEGCDCMTALVLADVRFAYPEPRLGALGAIGDRLHFVVFTVERRGIRIISLRKANRMKVRAYASED